MEKTVRVGMMPGRITEYAVETGAKVSEVLELAGLSPAGYDVKVDGVKVEPSTSVVDDTTALIMLVKQVKGNCEKTVRVGMMPGRITEYAIEIGTSIADLLKVAGLDATGYDVKVDGTKVNPSTANVSETTALVMLVKQVKGNK